MSKKSRYERKRDIYGNIVQVTKCVKDGIEETKYEYDLKGRLLNTSIYYSTSNQFAYEHYLYEDDEYGNIIKETILMEDQEIDELGNKIVIHEYKNVMYYKNTYSSTGMLQSTSMYGEEEYFYYTKKYIYKEDLLYMEELCNRNNEVYKTYYKYNEKKELIEKEFRLPTGEVSYYYMYKKIGPHDFSYTLVNPEKSNYKWKLSDISEDSVTIDIVEDLTTPEVYREIFEYIIKKYSKMRYLVLVASETDRSTYHNELQKVLQYYEEKYHIECDFAF